MAQQGLPAGRFKASNDYVFPAFDSGSLSVLPTPITRPVRRSFSTREEPVLNFLSESVIDAGGEILEPIVLEATQPEVAAVAPRPPRPASTTPVSQLQQQQQLDQLPPPMLPERRPRNQLRINNNNYPFPTPPQHNFANRSASAMQLQQPQQPLPERQQAVSNSMSFVAFDGDATEFDRSAAASWRDSGVDASHASNA